MQAGCWQPLPALLGAAGRTSTGSTTPLQLWKVKSKPWRCSSPPPTQTQAVPQLFWEKGWEIKGYQGPWLCYLAGSSCSHWLLILGVPFWGLRSCLHSPSPLQGSHATLAPWFLLCFLFCAGLREAEPPEHPRPGQPRGSFLFSPMLPAQREIRSKYPSTSLRTPSITSVLH